VTASIADLEAAEEVARADVAESATAYVAAKLSGDLQAIQTASDTLGRCISEFSARHADLINATGTPSAKAGTPEPEAEA
jgi:hypothetical protein